MKISNHMSAESAREILNRTYSAPRKPLSLGDSRQKRTKYKNHIVKTEDGTTFDSKAEYRHWCHLLIRAKTKEIFDLQRQVPFVLAPAVVYGGTKHRQMVYIADMTYRDGRPDGPLVVVDVKGAVTEGFRLKRHLMAAVHGIDIKLVKAT